MKHAAAAQGNTPAEPRGAAQASHCGHVELPSAPVMKPATPLTPAVGLRRRTCCVALLAAGVPGRAVRAADDTQPVIEMLPVPGATGPTLVSPTVLPGAAVGIGEYYTGVVSGLGLTAQDAGVRAAAQAAFVDHLAAQRQDVSGVSIDEEMVRLIEHQQAYSAAARLVQVADEMLRELINLGR